MMHSPTLKARLTVYLIPGKTYHIPNRKVGDFQFPDVWSQASGQITLIDREELKFGDTADVYIKMMFPQLVGDATVGTYFEFVHGRRRLGEGRILEIYDEAILSRKNYPGMTVNERLYVSGKHQAFDDAIKARDNTRMMQILYSVGVDINSIRQIIKQALSQNK